MTNNRWTVLLMRGESESVRQFTLPAKLTRSVLVSLAGAFVFFALATAYLALGGSARVQAHQLAQENELLEQELSQVQARLAQVDLALGTLVAQEERVRTLAGMAGIDEEVLEVGVGGPGLTSPDEGELWTLDPEASEAAYAVRYDLEVLERRMDLLSESLIEAADSMQAQRQLLEATPTILPAAGLLSSRFSQNRFHPILHEFRAHPGIDVHAQEGTPILAAANGVVVSAGKRSGYGNAVILDHGYGFRTLYGHASKLLVKSGQRVRRGDVIAQVGSTGLATASHLHYEVHVRGRPVNPMDYVLAGEVP
ncbi:MAG: M23 family metallopeptidase [Gemmatimonadota bacterium]|nr:M23 family metallopeptidase [Gemmatimonadota bacterium]